MNCNASPTILRELGEINMGDPDVEGDFADFVATYFPADNYAVTTYDHGSGWGGFGGDMSGTGISTMRPFSLTERCVRAFGCASRR